MATSAFSNQTEAAKVGLNLTLAPVEKFILDGLVGRLQKVMEAPCVVVSSDSDKAVALQKLFGTESQGPNVNHMRTPYAFLTLQNQQVSETHWNASALARGVVAVFDGQDKKAYRVSLLPTEFTFQYEYVTTDFQQVTTAATRLMFASRRGWLKFNVSYGRVVFSVSVTLDPSVTIPTKQGEAGALQEYVLQITLTVRGFTSMPTLNEQQVVTQVALEAKAVSENGMNETTFWNWNPKASEAIDSVLAPGVVSRST